VRKITKLEAARFRDAVFRYYAANGRDDLPWRKTRDPYRILVSEFMLQQTQVRRVLDHYGRFVESFPDFHALASARLRSVLSAWSGLGYNRRALMLKKTAGIVASEHNGALPAAVDDLTALPGVGAATAGAVMAFAFGIAYPFIETNIRAVFIHFFFSGVQRVRDAEIMPLVRQTLDAEDPRSWYYALMDYGVMLKRSHGKAPRGSVRRTGQGRFEGSDRQARGLIIRALLERDMGKRELERATGLGMERLRSNASKLEREGMISRERGKYTIR
jgi:A/G-specific adenine glycosylase